MYKCCVCILCRKQRDETFCVIVSGEAIVGKAGHQRLTLHTNSNVYRWMGKYFDRVEMLPGTNPVAAHHFKINEYHYLAFANYQDNTGETQHFCDTNWATDSSSVTYFKVKVLCGGAKMIEWNASF